MAERGRTFHPLDTSQGRALSPVLRSPRLQRNLSSSREAANDPYEWRHVTDALDSPRTGSRRHSRRQSEDSRPTSLPNGHARPTDSSRTSLLPNGAPLSAEPSSYDDGKSIEDDDDDELSVAHSEDELLSGHPRPALHSSASRLQQVWHRIRHPPELVGWQKDVLKCSLAYLIASLFTFIDPLADLIGAPFDAEGPSYNAHFIATIATYYNPGKSVGQMLEANVFLVWAAAYSLVVCFASMGAAVAINRDGHEWLSSTVVLCLFLAPSMGFIAFSKQRISKPTFGSACSMTALINGVIICKEGAVHLGVFETDAILQMSFIVLLGAAISNVVCFLVWPGSSTSKLRGDVSKTLDAFAVLIDLTSRAFLLDEHGPLRTDQTLKSAFNTHTQSFNSLKSSFDAAKLELFDLRISDTIDIYPDLIASMNRLAQHLTGLRSGCTLQNRLQQAKREGTLPFPLDDELPSDPDVKLDSAQQRLRESARTFRAFERSVGPSLRKLTARHAQPCKSSI